MTAKILAKIVRHKVAINDEKTIPISNFMKTKYIIQPNAPVKPQKASSFFGTENNTANAIVANTATIN